MSLVRFGMKKVVWFGYLVNYLTFFNLPRPAAATATTATA